MPLASEKVALRGWHEFFLGEGRRAYANFGWLIGEKALRLMIGLVVTAWIARYLGPGDFGTLSYGLALIGLLLFIPSLGLDEIVKREVLQAPHGVVATMGSALRLRFAAGILVMAGLATFLATGRLFDPVESRLLLVLSGLLLQPALLLPELYFKARGAARYVTWAQMGAMLTGASLKLLLIHQGAALIWFGVATLVELAVVSSLLAWFARGQDCAGWWRTWDSSQARRLLKAGWPLMLAGAAVMLYMQIGQVMLRHLADEAEVGIYTAAARISEAIYFVPLVMVTGLLPYWAAARDRGPEQYERVLQGIFDLLTMLALAFAVLISLAAGEIVATVFGSAYAGAGPVLAMHVWAGVFVFQGMVRSQAWILEDWGRLTLATTVTGVLCNVMLNLAWIPRHGAAGAAASTLASYAVAAWIMSFFFAQTRRIAWVQTRALLIPFRCFGYLFRR